MAVPVVAEVRHQLIKVPRARLERATRGQVNVANDLVHANATGNVAALVSLLLELVGPAFRFTLSTHACK